MAKTTPRGIRNNNPGNIERGKDRWLGMSSDQSVDPRFLVFDKPESGIRAIMRVLINYQERHNINTLRTAIHRWAPPGENDSSSYVQHVSRLTGLDPDESIDFMDEYICTAVTKAIVRHECGAPDGYGMPESWYADDVYQRAAVMSGFDPATKPLSQSRTVAGAVIAAAGTVGTVVAASQSSGLPITADDVTTVVQVVGPLLGASVMGVLSPIASIIGIGLTIYARWDDARRKIR